MNTIARFLADFERYYDIERQRREATIRAYGWGKGIRPNGFVVTDEEAHKEAQRLLSKSLALKQQICEQYGISPSEIGHAELLLRLAKRDVPVRA